jgi:hypothetical protein
MKTGPGGLAIIVVSFSGSLAFAQTAPGAPKAAPPPPPAAAPPAGAPSGPPKPAAQVDQLKFFAGNWSCEGKGFAPTEHPIKANVKVKSDLNNFWQTFVYEEKKTRENPGAAKVAGMWGWDAGGKRFVRADADSMGGWFSPTSTGWAGDQFVWVGDMSSPAGMLPARHTFSKKSDKEFVHALELNIQGKNTPIFEVTCKK